MVTRVGGGGSTVLWSTNSTETFLGTATKGFSLYYCYLHCKGSLPFKCGKRLGQTVFPPTGKQEEQEKRCAPEEEHTLTSWIHVQRGIHTLCRTPVSSASWFTHGSKSDGSWMSPHQNTLRYGRVLKQKRCRPQRQIFLWDVTDAGSQWRKQLPLCPPLPWIQTEGRNAGHISGTPAGRQRGTSGTSYSWKGIQPATPFSQKTRISAQATLWL